MVSESWSDNGSHRPPDGPPGERAGGLEYTGERERAGACGPDPASDLDADRAAEPLRLLLVADESSTTEGTQRRIKALAAALARAGYAVTLAYAPGGDPLSPAD